MAIFQYKYVVDGTWYHSEHEPSIWCEDGHANNIVLVKGGGGGGHRLQPPAAASTGLAFEPNKNAAEVVHRNS